MFYSTSSESDKNDWIIKRQSNLNLIKWFNNIVYNKTGSNISINA